MTKLLHKKKHLTSFQMIISGFAFVIFIGALILMLPISSKGGIITPFNKALFTSTSAVCVTGLVVLDTASYWSGFGQFIILLLIQIGGMGVITVGVLLSILSGKKISLMQRNTMQESIGAPKVGGIVRLTSFIIKTTFFFELTGALVMMPVFCRDFGARGVWMAVFHSISAFCNAGFDLMGTEKAPFASLTTYMGNPLINITIILLIIIGGIGFYTWDDIRTNKYHWKRYRMQSKVIIATSLILLILPFLYFYCFESGGLSTSEKILSSLFQSAAPRTAGFNTVNLALFSGVGQCIVIILMLIGGSPGSTAGGMKTTTIAVLFANAIAVFRRKEDTHFFGRRIDEDVIKNAATILILYLFLFVSGALIISAVEKIPLGTCMFEAASAMGTAGLTLGITSGLGIISQITLMILMFFGRVGGLTLIYAAFSGIEKNFSRLPQEKITVG